RPLLVAVHEAGHHASTRRRAAGYRARPHRRMVEDPAAPPPRPRDPPRPARRIPGGRRTNGGSPRPAVPRRRGGDRAAPASAPAAGWARPPLRHREGGPVVGGARGGATAPDLRAGAPPVDRSSRRTHRAPAPERPTVSWLNAH